MEKRLKQIVKEVAKLHRENKKIAKREWYCTSFDKRNKANYIGSL